MNGGHIAALIFWLIFVGLLLKNWPGANALLGTGGKVSTGVISQLQAG